MTTANKAKTIALAAGLSLLMTAAPTFADTDSDMAMAMPTIETVRSEGYVVSRMVRNPREGHLKLVAYNKNYERQLTLSNTGDLMLDQTRPLSVAPLIDSNGRMVFDEDGLPVPASEGPQISSNSGSNSSSGSGSGSGSSGSGSSGSGDTGGDTGSGDSGGGGIGVSAGVGGIGVGVGIGFD